MICKSVNSIFTTHKMNDSWRMQREKKKNVQQYNLNKLECIHVLTNCLLPFRRVITTMVTVRTVLCTNAHSHADTLQDSTDGCVPTRLIHEDKVTLKPLKFPDCKGKQQDPPPSTPQGFPSFLYILPPKHNTKCHNTKCHNLTA